MDHLCWLAFSPSSTQSFEPFLAACVMQEEVTVKTRLAAEKRSVHARVFIKHLGVKI